MTTTLQSTTDLDSCSILQASTAPLFITFFLQAGGCSPLTWHWTLDSLIHWLANQQIKTDLYVAAGHLVHYNRDAELTRVARAFGLATARFTQLRCFVCFELLATLWVFFNPRRWSHDAFICKQTCFVSVLPEIFVKMISSPETTSAGLANLICLLWLAGTHHSTFLLFKCSWAGGAVQNRWYNGFTFWLSVEYFAGCSTLLWKTVIRACPCFDLQHRGRQWTASHSLFFFPSHSFVVDVWFEEKGWMSAWFWGVQITFYWPIILTQEAAVWSIPVRTR